MQVILSLERKKNLDGSVKLNSDVLLQMKAKAANSNRKTPYF